MQSPVSSAPYAEASFSQQNTQSGRETFQDHGARQGFKKAVFAPPFALGKKRETQTAAE